MNFVIRLAALLAMLNVAPVFGKPVFAKDGRISHSHSHAHGAFKTGAGKASATKVSGRGAAKPPNATAGSRDNDAAEKSEPGGPPPAASVAAKPHDINVRAKAPAKTDTRRGIAPAVPAARNAIGMTAAPGRQVPAANGAAAGKTAMTPGAGAPAAAPGLPKPGEAKAGIPSGLTNAQLHPIAAGVAGQNKTGSAGVIRPAAAPAGLGGPAKTAYGINGTAIRSKHY